MAENDFHISWLTFFTYDPRERRAGDDIGIVVFGIAVVFGVVFRYSGISEIMNIQDDYTYLTMVCAIFLAYHFWRVSNQDIKHPDSLYILKLAFVPLILMGMLYLTGLVLSQIIPGVIGSQSGVVIPTVSFSYWLYEYTQIIPIEEVAFRGLIIEVFVIAGAYIDKVRNNFGIKENLFRARIEKPESIADCFEANAWFFIGGIVSGVLFGVLHHLAYPGQIFPLVYLTLLGLVLAYLRFKYGLASCMLLHAWNNIIASIVPGILGILFMYLGVMK